MSNQPIQCGRCNRELKTEKSKKIGFGPVCKQKYEAEKAAAEAEACKSS